MPRKPPFPFHRPTLQAVLSASLVAEDETSYDKLRVIAELEQEMRDASSKLEFERAAHLRDQIATLKNATPVMSPQRKG